jgi:hypothetical protein
MSKEVEISFHGMGGLVSSASCVVMPNRQLSGGTPGHVHGAGGEGPSAHQTRLVIPTDPNVLDRSDKTWPPDEVVVYGDMELGLWILDGLDVEVETGEPKTPATTRLKAEPPGDSNDMVARWDVISLREIHPEAVTRPDWKTIDGCARVTVYGGTFRGGGKARFANAGRYTGRDVSSYLSWKSNRVDSFALKTTSKGPERRIRLSMSAGPDKLSLSITNGAREAGNHFPIMYSLINSAKRPLIAPTEDMGEWTYPAETCKPPVDMPEP